MKILQISPHLGVPQNTGANISVFGITKYLSLLGHEVDFVSYRKDFNAETAKKELSRFCNPIILDVQTENKIIPALLNLFSSVPYNISKYISSELREYLEEYFKKSKPDVVHIDHLHMAWVIDVIREISDVPVVLREHNLEMNIMKRFAERENNFFVRKYATYQAEKLRKYEIRYCKKFDKCLMITSVDEEQLQKMTGNVDTKTIEAGVDEKLLNIKRNVPIPFSLFHVGSLDWYPNLEGLEWFLSNIMPDLVKINPSIKLFVYGTGTKKIKLNENIKRNVELIGFVENLTEQILDKDLMIVPLRIGSGIRLKILEMLGMGMNIICTSIGKEGIKAEDNEQLLIADSELTFVKKIDDYFKGKYDKEEMSSRAKDLIRENYTWPIIAKKFEDEYLALITKHNRMRIK
ncbi:MAG: glycosyltransferase family 4 protein [Ignavibacteriaceae bacterium]